MKYIQFCLIAGSFIMLFACSADQSSSETLFNANWKFHLGDDPLAMDPYHDDFHWRKLNLPHDWSIEGEFNENHTTKPAGGALPAGIGWYRKKFRLDESERDQKFFIDFDGIYRNSEVWINGHLIGKRANGYISFRYELTPYLKFGDTNNVIAVRVDNSLQPNSRWYTGSGIYRNVRFIRKQKVHISHWGISVTTPKINEKQAEVVIETSLNADKTLRDNILVETYISDEDGMLLNRSAVKPEIKDSLLKAYQSIVIQDPELWSPENPKICQVLVKVFVANRLVDQQNTSYGFRYFHFDADSGFFLNGTRYEIRGVNLHHDLGALGAAVNKRAIQRQMEILKGMGVNAIRTAHNPPAPELLDLCDQMGFLVMNESFDVWKKKKVKYDYHVEWDQNHRRDLRDLVLRDRNHPSVFMWCIGNEIREQFDSTGLTITKELADIVKQIDTTRPVTCALTETDPDKNFIYQSGALDILSFNYKHQDWAKFKVNFPGEKMLASENMSAYATRGHYDMPSDSTRYWPVKHGDQIIGANKDYTVSAYDMVCAYWGAIHEETLRAFYKHDFINGLFIWSGFDYIGEPVPYEWPAKNSYFGVVDLAGFPKDVYYLYQSIWTDTPTLHVFPHWNWEKGKTVDIWAYYNAADEVELFINNVSQGAKKKEGDQMHVMWRVKYEPGLLKAVSRKNGEIILVKEIKTADTPARIELTADRQTIRSDGHDLSFITAKVLDNEGNLVPNADNLIEFKIEGSGFIAGVDNGYQASHESFKAGSRKAWKGLCLAIIQSDGTRGEVRLTATSENLKTAEISLWANK